MVALALAAPQKPLPRHVWPRIARAIDEQTRRKSWSLSSFWTVWWHNGWAVAGACLVGWLLYAFWPNVPAPASESDRSLIAESQPAQAVTGSTQSPAGVVTAPSGILTNSIHNDLLASGAGELTNSRQRIRELEKRVNSLSRTLTRQEALLAESSRFKFYVLSPASGGGSALETPLSPALQRAVFLAMSRELGWLPALASTNAAYASYDQAWAATDLYGVDFADPQSSPEHTLVSTSPPTESESRPGTGSSSPTLGTNSPTIPAFVCGHRLFVAVDSSVAPSGTQLTFTYHGESDERVSRVATVGEKPLVVVLPIDGDSLSGEQSYLGITASDGSSNTFQFSAPTTGP